MPDTGSVVMISIIGAAILFQLVIIMKRVINAAVIGYRAKLFISGGFFLPFDKGARLAYKGVCDCFKQRFEKAIVSFEKAMKYSYETQNCVFCLDWMSKCYDAVGKPEMSFNCCVKSVEISPGNIQSLLNLAERYLGKGKLEKARYYYQNVLKYDADNDYAKFMTGIIDMLSGDYSKAAEMFYPVAENTAVNAKTQAAGKFPLLTAEAAIIAAIQGDKGKSRFFLESALKSGYEETERLSGRIDCIEKMRKLCLDDS